VSLFFVILLFSCKVQKESISNLDLDPFEIYHETIISKGKSILKFTIKNKTNQNLILFEPSIVRIEYFIKSNWKAVRILACPCGAPCAPPKKEVVISQKDSFKLSWNKKEEWCGELNDYGIPKSYSKLSDEGEYRLKIYYKISDNKTKTKLYPFKLKY
jgi:hypothetical protein